MRFPEPTDCIFSVGFCASNLRYSMVSVMQPPKAGHATTFGQAGCEIFRKHRNRDMRQKITPREIVLGKAGGGARFKYCLRRVSMSWRTCGTSSQGQDTSLLRISRCSSYHHQLCARGIFFAQSTRFLREKSGPSPLRATWRSSHM